MPRELKLVPQHAETKKKFVRVTPSLLLNTESGFYYVRKTFKRYRLPPLFETTKETLKGKAQARADVMIAEHLNKYLGNATTDLTARRTGKCVREVVEEILLTVTPQRRAGTQEMHKIYLNEISDEWGAWDLNRITLPAWQAWMKTFRTKKKRTTFGDYSKHMNLILRYAYNQKYASHLIKIPNADPVGNQKGRVFTRKEIKTLWKHMNEETRDQFVLCYECFMRLREALKLTWERVNLKTGVVTLRAEDVKTGSKTGRGRSFNVSAHALKRLRARKKLVDSIHVFPSPTDAGVPVNQNKDAWKRAKVKAGIKGKARWHDLRHTALSRALLEEGTDPVQVSEYSGVSIRTIQKVYLHSTHEKTASVAKSVSIF